MPRFLDYAGPAGRSRSTAAGRVAFLDVNGVQRPNWRFRSSIARPTDAPIHASTGTSRCPPQDSGPRWIRYSFLVGLFHSQQHAGLSRRTHVALTEYTTDLESEEPDYIVATQTGYFIDIETATARWRFAPLSYSDTAFFARFRRPASNTTLDGEVWRLYSRSVQVGGNKSLELLVGCTVGASGYLVASGARSRPPQWK